MKKYLLLLLAFVLAASSADAQTNKFAATIFKALTNDVSITNTTNMTVISALTITTEANKRYAFQLFPIISAAATSTALQIVASNATVYGFWDGTGSGSYSTTALTSENGFGITTGRAPWQTFYVLSGTNAGSISVQFRSSIATNTNTIGAGSFMRADKLP